MSDDEFFVKNEYVLLGKSYQTFISFAKKHSTSGKSKGLMSKV